MSENTTKMEISIIPKFLDVAATPIAREIGERLSDIISLMFTPVIKIKAKRDKNLALFLKSLDKKVSEIPEDKLQSPSLSVIGPPLENIAKFYHDEEHLRELYARLIASSMNKDNFVHPSYFKVVEQLLPYDAHFFYSLFRAIHKQNIRSKSYEFEFFQGNERIYIYTCAWKKWNSAKVIIEKKEIKYFYSESPNLAYNGHFKNSLINLHRLGLIDVIDDRRKSLEKETLDTYGISLCLDTDRPIFKLIVKPTLYGEKFANACLDYTTYKQMHIKF